MAKKNQTPPKNFEEALSELETILAEIESGEIGLEESLTKYERGTFLIQHCRGVLTTAEKQIELLSRAPDGGMRSEPMRDDAEDGREGPAGEENQPLPPPPPPPRT
jgi:exodeoxyribonuclease VII small subunit